MKRFLSLGFVSLIALSALAAPPAREREEGKQKESERRHEEKSRDDGDRWRGDRDGGGVIIVGQPYPYPVPYPYPDSYPGPKVFRASSVAFERDGTLWESFVNGGLPQPVLGVPPAGAREPARSPVWGRLAFVTPLDGVGAIRWITAEGRKPKTVTSPKWGRASQPTWSPDDKRIAFVSDRDGSDEIYLVGESGGKVRRLTNNAARDVRPAFSSDGRSVYFVSDRDGEPSLYRQRIDRSDAERVQGVPRGTVLDVATARNNPALVVTVETKEAGRQLFLVVPDSASPARQLGDGKSDDDYPVQSPDGSKVAFRSKRDGARGIWLWDRAADRFKRLTEGEGDSRPALW